MITIILAIYAVIAIAIFVFFIIDMVQDPMVQIGVRQISLISLILMSILWFPFLIAAFVMWLIWRNKADE